MGRKGAATGGGRALAIGLAGLLGLAPAVTAHTPDGAVGGTAIRAAADHAAMITARTRFFGARNVDQGTGAVRRDRVILSWFGVANFAMAIRGHVVLLNAWVPRGAFSGYVPTTPEELATLRPTLILIGHAHFDHAADATPLAVATGAPLGGTAEHCADLRARDRSPAMPPRCIELTPRGAAIGTRADRALLRGVEVTVVKHLHSGATRPDSREPYHAPVLPVPGTTPLEHPPTVQDVASLVGHLPDAEGGDLLYRFRVGDLSLVWHDTSGPAADHAPGLFHFLRQLRPVDVHLGAIQSFNQFYNGMRDPRHYIEAIKPRLFVPTHHDDWMPGITMSAEGYRAPFYEELAKLNPDQRPEVRFIRDPADYVRPEALTFPVQLDPVRLVRRCAGRGGRLRARLDGDVADVKAVRFSASGYRTRHDTSAPFAGRLARRRGVPRPRRARVRARVVEVDGAARTLRRTLPRC